MSIFSGEIRSEFFKSPMGLAGIGILGILISVSIGAGIFIPLETFQEWNNPGN